MMTIQERKTNNFKVRQPHGNRQALPGGGGDHRDPSEPISGSWGGCCGERSVLQWPELQPLKVSFPGLTPRWPEGSPCPVYRDPRPCGPPGSLTPSSRLSLSPLPSHGNPSSCLTQHQLPGHPPESGAEADRRSRKGMPARPSLQEPTRCHL